MTFTALDSMGKTSLMLDLISQKQRALGANVANVDTPGYIRKDIDFSQYIGSMNSPIETKLSTATFFSSLRLPPTICLTQPLCISIQGLNFIKSLLLLFKYNPN